MKNNTSVIKKNLFVLKYVFKFCPKLIYFSILHMLASVVKSLSKVILITEAINLVIRTQDINDMYKLINSLLLYVFIIIGCSIVNVVYENYLQPRYQLIYQKNIQRFLYSKVKNIDMESFDDPVFYDKYSRACRDSSWRGFRVFNSIISFITNVLTVIALGTFIIINEKWLIIIVVLSSIINVLTLNKINKLWYKVYKETETEHRYQWYVNRTFYHQKNAAELKTTNIDKLLIQRYKDKTKDIEKKFQKTYKKLYLPEGIGLFFSTIINQAGTYIILGYRLLKNKIGIASFTSTVNATLQFSNNFNQAISIFTSLKEHSLYIDDFIWVINYTPIVEKEKEFKQYTFENLKLENINFTYPKTDILAINDISLEIKKGQRIAIVGDNGGGKTTLMKLLLSFYEPSSGCIKVNDINYTNLSTKQIRSMYSIVFQDFQIYATTIAENILMRRIENDQDIEVVLNALEKVGLKEKVLNLPRGIYTPVTREFDRDGISFSGGERQRLVIARVFASNRDIYILDEPTSSLDPLAEEKINKLIMNQDKEKTMIIIAHRLSTVVDADIIYLIRKGKIIEKGKHEELMKLKGQYSIMFNAQKHLYESK